jgi:hypothetical protein
MRWLQDIAMYIKKEVRTPAVHTSRDLDDCWISTKFDSRKGATWHCIVGRNFGSFVTHGKTRSTAGTCSGSFHCANGWNRNQALHIFLSRPLRHLALQDPISFGFHCSGVELPFSDLGFQLWACTAQPSSQFIAESVCSVCSERKPNLLFAARRNRGLYLNADFMFNCLRSTQMYFLLR